VIFDLKFLLADLSGVTRASARRFVGWGPEGDIIEVFFLI
jgi:hypothetical protein